MGENVVEASSGVVLEARDLQRVHGGRAVLRGVSLTVAEGGFVAVVGPSGSGKSTLLHLLGGLDTPTGGEVRLRGRRLADLDDRERAEVRRHLVGFVFQAFHLVPVLTALENVALPALVAGRPAAAATVRARELLELVGVADRGGQRPVELSGGEQQRVAVARALSMSPALVLADEPTGNLDSEAGAGVLELLTLANRELGQAVVVVTHDARVAAAAAEVVRLVDGAVVDAATVVTAGRASRPLVARR